MSASWETAERENRKLILSPLDLNSGLSVEEAEKNCVAGASVWAKYSTEGGLRPDVVLVGIGVEVTMEVIAAAAVLRNEGVRVRVVNIVDLMILGEPGAHPHALSEDAFASLFTKDRPGESLGVEYLKNKKMFFKS